VKRLDINGGEGDDTIQINGREIDKPAVIHGDAGNDRIFWSSSGPVLADGGDGNDMVGNGITINALTNKNRDVLNTYFAAYSIGSNPIDSIFGGDGDDSLRGDTNDVVDGGNGNDTGMVLVDPQKLIQASRRDPIAHDFYARIGATSLELMLSE
jgi:Ca2+-binding RTX toxin-like protein